MRKISIEQYVRLINYFIDKSVDPQSTEYERLVWTRSAYRLKEYFEGQGTTHDHWDWDKLAKPTYAKAWAHINWFLDREEQVGKITSNF